MRTPTPRRLRVARNVVFASCAAVLSVLRAIDGDWWWFALGLVVFVLAAVDLVRAIRSREVEPDH